MNYNEYLTQYFYNYPFEEPIFIDDIKNNIATYVTKNNDNLKKVMNNVYIIINRLVKKGELELFAKGIYYKPTIGLFGATILNDSKVIQKKYIEKNNQRIGYITGAYLYNSLGLTTQVPKKIDIATNECPNNNQYENKRLSVIIRKPKLEINNDNYLYLQLLDLLGNKDEIAIEVENEKDIVYNFINDNELKIEKIFEYANLTKNKKAIEKLYNLG